MPLWAILLVVVWVAGMGAVMMSSAAKRGGARESLSGEVIEVRRDSIPEPGGMRGRVVVTVQTGDGQAVELVDPPYRSVAVGDRIVGGVLFGRPRPGVVTEPSDEA